MALTRAQLLSGNNNNGITLPGQPQGVIAGAGINISTTGIISVDSSSVTGLVKLNNPFGYNAYVWPGADGTSGEFLQTDGTGNLAWATPQGFAVVTVQPSPAPVPAEVGELWFDCSSGTLNVYQNCVGTSGWFNVAQPGFPVLPGNTNASPGFTGGSGIQADPYDCTVTTTGSGSTVQIIQTVTVSNLAPFQFVPIVDLNAVANGGRFSFTNNYADALGDLTFDILFTDNPPSASGTPYTAAIKVGYGSAYIEAIVNVVAALVVTGGSITGPLYVGQQLTYTPGVPSGGSTPYGSPTIQWFANGVAIGSATATTFTLTGAQLGAQITASTSYTDASAQTATGTSAAVGPVLAAPAALTITSPGSIAPTTASVGTTLNYTAGTFTGGIPTVTASWKWQRAGVDISGVPANAISYLTVGADAGQAITVRYQVQDSATPTNTTLFQSTPAVTPTQPFPPAVWSPTPAGAMNANNPGTSSGTWNGPAGTVITATGCVEVSTDGTGYSASVTVTNPQVLYQRWKQTPACGTGPTGTPMTGTVTDGTNTNSYALTVNRLPAAFTFSAVSGAALGSVQQSNSVSITGLNSPAYVTYGAASTGTVIQGSTDGGTTWVNIPASGTTFPVANSDNLLVHLTTNNTPSSTNTAIINIGDGDNVQQTSSTFTVTNTTSAAFPGLTFSNGGAPNAAPETVNAVAGGGSLGTLNGVANSNSWPASFGTTLSSPGGTPTMKFRKNSTGVFVTSGLSVVPTDILNLAWNEAYLATVTDGATATGTITGTVSGTPYTNSFTMSVKRSASWTVPADPGNAALSTQQTTNPITVNNFNVPVTVSFAAPTGPAVAMSAVQAVVGGVTTNITLGTTTVTLNPGQTFEVLGDTGNTGGTAYGVKITIGTATAQDWLVTTSAVPNAIQAPVMSPTGGPLNPAVNSPAGITLGGGTYTIATGSPGAHTSTDWELYKANLINPETSAIVSVATNAPVWTQRTQSAGTGQFEGVAYGNGVFVAKGNSSLSQKSTDGGVTWSSTGGANNSVYFVSYGNGRFVNGFGFGDLSVSTNDGASWSTVSTQPGPSFWFGGVYDGSSTWVFVGNGGKLQTANADLSSFTVQTSGFGTSDIYTVGYGGGQWVIGGTDQKLATSATGSSWTLQNSNTPVGTQIRNIAYGNGLWVAACISGGFGVGIITSSDGINWTFNSSVTGLAVDYSDGLWVVLGGSSVFTSTDGLTWSSSSPAGLSSATMTSVAGGGGNWVTVGGISPNSFIAGTSAPAGTTVLTLTNTTDLSSMVVGDTVVEVGGGADATGTITAINTGTPSITVAPSSTAWTGGSVATAKDTSRTITAPTPTTDPPSATKYTQVVNVANDASNLETYLVAQSLLTTSSTYYSRARYKASSTSTVSPWANWASFNTAAVFLPSPGTAYNGGYFGGQINDGGIVYNLIVAPKASGEYNSFGTPLGINWKSTASADTSPSAAFWENAVYGFPASQAGNSATYPAMQFARNLTISGYNDWYLPAQNELEVLYYFLKPDSASGGTLNVTSSGANPNAVSPEPVSTNYTTTNPAQTTANDFKVGGTQAFSGGAGSQPLYWSSSQRSGIQTAAWGQQFGDGNQGSLTKNASTFNNGFARAIRREYANAPVAIGAAFGGGFFAGQYQDGGLTYNLIVAPVATGQFASTIQYKNASSADPNPALAQNAVYGDIAQANALAQGAPTGTYPAFEWAGGLTIATFSDWYIPAKNELAILCYNLGPNWTTASAFKAGTGAEAFSTGPNAYWSSTENSSNTVAAWVQNFGFGQQDGTIGKINVNYARVVRRVLA